MEQDTGSLALTLHVGEGFTVDVSGKGLATFYVKGVNSLRVTLEYATAWEPDSEELVQVQLDDPLEFFVEGEGSSVFITLTFTRQDGIRAKLLLEAPREYKIMRLP